MLSLSFVRRPLRNLISSINNHNHNHSYCYRHLSNSSFDFNAHNDDGLVRFSFATKPKPESTTSMLPPFHQPNTRSGSGSGSGSTSTSSGIIINHQNNNNNNNNTSATSTWNGVMAIINHHIKNKNKYKNNTTTTTNKRKKNKMMSKSEKLRELRYFRLKARRKMHSPNPCVRMQYKLDKAKRKQAWLVKKLSKLVLPNPPPDTYDPEILTDEDKFYLKRTGEKKKHYVPLGRRGVIGGVILNMHLHWKNHETVKVVCRPCRPGEVHHLAQEIARLSKGVVIDIKPDNTVLFYRGKNYVHPDFESPQDILSKAKALKKYKYQQSLEHISDFIQELEKELEEYKEHRSRFRRGKDKRQCMKAYVVNDSCRKTSS